MARPTNQQLVEEFKSLLTEGFYTVNSDGEVLDGRHAQDPGGLRATKLWRGELWKALARLEKRLCPRPGMIWDD